MVGYEQLTYDILNYVNGLPLAIKVWGSFLFGRDESEWRSALGRLRETPRKDIMDVLRISFDGLEDTEKEIFLDIACFFNGYGKKYVKNILDCCGFHSDIGIRVLIDKSLISANNWIIHMHDLLRELGMSIVQEKSPNEPWKWNRLWCYIDFQNVMFKHKATENIEAIFLKQCGENQDNATLKAETLSQMRHIRLLILQNGNIFGNLNYLSNELRYLEWDKCPLTYLPSNFQPDKLVELILPRSSIKQLWEDIKPLQNLKILNLCHSKDLIEVPDFRAIPNLKQLNLEGCIKLMQIHESIGLLQKLKSLNLKDCRNLVSIPNNILDLGSLEVLNISGCLKLLNNQPLEKALHATKYWKLSDIRETFVQCRPTFSISKMLRMPFHFLYSSRHEDSIGLLLPSLPSFPCLRDLDLSFCNLLKIPDAIASLHCLERLNLGGNRFGRLPCNIKKLHKLSSLNLEHCNQLESLPELPSSIVLPASKGELRAGLYIFNCPKLGDMEHCYRMTFSWMIQILQLWSYSSSSPHFTVPFRLIEIVIPGSQIPRWFNNQSVGSSISIDSLPIMQDCNWIGIACCVAFVARDDPTNLRKGRKAYIGCGFECKEGGWYPFLPIHLQKNQVTIELDHHHLWLLFFPREEFIAMLTQITKTNDLEILQLATTLEDPPGLRLEVQNCGFRWVFKHDLEQLSPTTMCSTSSKGMEIDDHFTDPGNSLVRKCKFFAIDY